MTKTEYLRKTADAGIKNPADVNTVCGLLKQILIDDKEMYNQFNPSSKSFVKKPGKRMAVKLQNCGLILVSEGVVLERSDYVFEIATDCGNKKIVVDYWNRRVYPE